MLGQFSVHIYVTRFEMRTSHHVRKYAAYSQECSKTVAQASCTQAENEPPNAAEKDAATRKQAGK